MCFFVPYADRNSKPLIAPEGGIECFKVVCPTATSGVYFSVYWGFSYRKSEQCPEIPLVVKKYVYESTIEDGYHSYCSLEPCRQETLRIASSVIVRCLIPAGSQYYKNSTYGEYVSSSIILLGEES